MPNACTSFLRKQDQLGTGVSLNYRGDTVSTTNLGGLCSLIATSFFTLYFFTAIYAWAFHPDFQQNQTVTYLSKEDAEEYSISVRDFLPTFYIETNIDGDLYWNYS